LELIQKYQANPIPTIPSIIGKKIIGADRALKDKENINLKVLFTDDVYLKQQLKKLNQFS
jgi:hypothetical protein